MKVEKNKPSFVFNMNDECEVVLTNVGAEWLNKYNEERFGELLSILASPAHVTEDMKKMFPTNNEEGEVVKGSLWEIMEKFGQYFYGNTEAPFKNNSISITQDR